MEYCEVGEDVGQWESIVDASSMISTSVEPADSIELRCRVTASQPQRSFNLDRPTLEDVDPGEQSMSHTSSRDTVSSPAPVKPRKNQVQTVDWDAPLDELKREKESAEAVWDKPNHGSQRPSLARARNASVLSAHPCFQSNVIAEKSDKVEDACHVSKPPDADGHAMSRNHTMRTRMLNQHRNQLVRTAVKPRKNQVHAVEWDASLDELKREKESAEAVWDLKTRFRQVQPRLTAPKSTPGRKTRKSDKVEDACHVSKPPDADGHVSKPLDGDADAEPVAKPSSKAELEDFLDDLLG
ncbi:hypothetical protein M422DRAFT_249062 [Sphaerobolus stellatus SS14]|nr:hypothetical protein M422DRAFT_249062 [Sphaerobolus stellatus SS14]